MALVEPRQKEKYQIGSDRKQPLFSACGKCGNPAKTLAYQTKSVKHNRVGLAYCPECQVITNNNNYEIVSKYGDKN